MGANQARMNVLDGMAHATATGCEERPPALTLQRLQAEQAVWSKRNFGIQPAHIPLLGALEELGELAHSHIKQEQGIRGTAAEHEAAAKDAVADVVIYLAQYCTVRGFDFQRCIEDAWAQVKQRDWKRNSLTGEAV